MLRLPQQSTAIVVFLFSALDVGITNFSQIFWVGIGLLFWSISLFLANDYYDSFDTDKHSVRERAGTQTIINPNIVFFLWTTFTVTSGYLLISFGLIWHFLILVITGYAYDCPPIRGKAKFPLDFLILLIQFITTYSISWFLINAPLTSFPIPQFLALFCFLAVAEGVHLIADREPDRLAGLKNMAVFFSYKQLVQICNFFLLVSTLSLFYLAYKHSSWWYYILIPFIPYVAHLIGYARGARDDLIKIESRFNKAYHIAVSLGNYVVIYQIGIFLWIFLQLRNG